MLSGFCTEHICLLIGLYAQPNHCFINCIAFSIGYFTKQIIIGHVSWCGTDSNVSMYALANSWYL